MKSYALAITLCMRSSLAALAQTATAPAIVPLDIKGLPRSDINSMVKDHDGFLWIGTSDGLCRYDGLNVDIYRNVPGDSLSLTHNRIGSLVLDERGNIWIGTGLGVCLLDPHRMRFERKDLLTAKGRSSRYEAYPLIRDKQGGIWSSHLDGFARYDQKTGVFQEVECVVAAAQAHRRRHAFGCAAQDEDGILWIPEGTALIRYDPDANSTSAFIFKPGGQEPPAATLLGGVQNDPNDVNTLWLTSWGLGIVRFDKRTNTFTNTLLTLGKPANISNITWCLAPLNDHQLLVGIDNELRPYDTHTGQFGPAVMVNAMEQVPFNSTAHSIHDDAQGQRWVGTSHGLYMVPRAAMGIETLGVGVLNCDALGGGYWGTRCYERRQLRRMDEGFNIIDSIPLPHADREGYEAFNLVQLHTGDVWLGTTKGLLVFDPNDRLFTWKRLTGLQQVGDRGPHIGTLIEQPDGSVWANVAGLDLIRYRPGTDDFVEANVPPGTPPTPHKLCYGVWPMDADHILLNYGEGFGVLDTRSMHVAAIMTTEDPGPGAQGFVSIVAHAHGELHAVSASNGVFVLRYTADSLQIIGHYQDATTGDSYFDAVADTLGNTWIATTSSLVRFRSFPPLFQQLGQRDGLSAGPAYQVFHDHQHRILTAGSQFVRFDPARIPLTVVPIAIYIRGVSVNGAPRPTSLSTDSALALSHDQNAVSIEYAPIALMNADQLLYEVRLDGSDAQWVDNGPRRTVSYIGLRPGTYSFHVRIAGDEAIVARFTFSILPAWWQTWWFRTAAALAIVLTVFLLSRYILRLQYQRRIAALEKEREVSALRTRMARDIHDDIGSGLTRITMLSRELNAPGDGNGDKQRLAGSIANASTELIGQLSEIVWTVDPRNDTAERFVAYVRDLLGRQFEELSVALRNDLTIEVGTEQRAIPPDVKRNVVLILKEAVSNALKHASAKVIIVRMHIGANELTLQVADDGKGFDPANVRAGGNGLGNLRKRAEAIGATLSVESNGSGTLVGVRCHLVG